jgi:hypothetical protein
MDLSQQPHPALKLNFSGDLTVSVAFTRVASRVMGIPFARASMTKWGTAVSTSGVALRSSWWLPYTKIRKDERLLHLL